LPSLPAQSGLTTSREHLHNFGARPKEIDGDQLFSDCHLRSETVEL
jgi:hypothetical protein